MILRTFDVFDTLLTRTVAVPLDLFIEIADRAGAQGLLALDSMAFRQARADAERAARRKTHHGEVSLGEIYEQLAADLKLSRSTAAALERIELELEDAAIRPVPGAKEAVERARQECDRVLFLSDMYLPGTFLRDRLRREGFLKDDAELFLSSELKVSKGRGTLYEHIKGKFSPIERWVHVGDHPRADVEMPAKAGIETMHFTWVHLNRYEILARGDGEELWRSRLAGAMRLARLESPGQTDRAADHWSGSCDVVGPVLFGFVHWCLRQAEERGINRLYFISRDGQILQRMAAMISEKWEFRIDCRYLYGSRQAWHPAAIGRLAEKDLAWILTPTKFLSVRRVFSRLGFNPDPVAPALERSGFKRPEWDRNLSAEERAGLGRLLLDAPVRSEIESASNEKRRLALDYFKQEGLLDAERWAMVDIGWHGRMQESLSRLLSKPVTGLYFGLVDGGDASAEQARLSYWNQGPEGRRRIQQLNWALIEIFSAADHGPVVGYENFEGGVRPVLMSPKNEALLKWGLAEQHLAVLSFTSALLGVLRRNAFTPTQLLKVSEELLRLFYEKPSFDEALAWGGCPFSDDQYAADLKPFVPNWTCREATTALFCRGRRPPFWWHEASLALHPCLFLRLYIALRRLKQSLL